MRDFRINWAVILALIVLLGFTYFSFMGVLYNQKYVNGDLVTASLFAAGVILIVAVCVVVMCVSRATRWKEIGTAGQVVFALIILAVFGVSAIPFTGFMKAIDSKQEISDAINNTQRIADEIDQAYNNYVDKRVAAYDAWLRADSTRYQNAGGSTDSVKIANLTTSLRNHLAPPKLAQCQNTRRDWLGKVQGMSVWNIKLPRNIQYLNEAAKSWKNEYVALSDISFDGNPPKLFEYPVNEDNPLKELGEFKNVSWVAIGAALLSFFFMLLPYIVTRPFIGGKESKNNNGQPGASVDYE